MAHALRTLGGFWSAPAWSPKTGSKSFALLIALGLLAIPQSPLSVSVDAEAGRAKHHKTAKHHKKHWIGVKKVKKAAKRAASKRIANCVVTGKIVTKKVVEVCRDPKKHKGCTKKTIYHTKMVRKTFRYCEIINGSVFVRTGGGGLQSVSQVLGNTGSGGGTGGTPITVSGIRGSHVALSGTIAISGTVTVPGGMTVSVNRSVGVAQTVRNPITTAPAVSSGFASGAALGSATSLGLGSAAGFGNGAGNSFTEVATSGAGAGSSGGNGSLIGAGLGFGSGVGISASVD